MHSVHPTPKFSIITVTYNAEKVLEDTIQSVISQTYHHIEYIIVDGASKDGTISIINRYRPHIHTVVSEPDKGLYDAMNKGIALASGDYLCFLERGRLFSRGRHTTTNGAYHQRQRTARCALRRNRYRRPGQAFPADAQIVRSPKRLPGKSFKQGMLVCHRAFFPRHTLVEPYNLKYRFSADFDWCIRIMKKARTLHNTHLTIIDYLDEGMTTRNQKASPKERFPDHGKALRADWNRGASCMVRDPCSYSPVGEGI